MPYITTPAPIRYPQITLDDILNAPQGAKALRPIGHAGDTRTHFTTYIPYTIALDNVIRNAVNALVDFNRRYDYLRAYPRQNLYHHFTIPKRNGKRRPIDAPNDDLMRCLRELKGIFETFFFASNHTAAFAYVKHRCALDAVKRHQANDSKWVLKTDLSNFFPNTTFDFTWRMLTEIYPFSEVIRHNARGKEELRKALDLCFLNGGLPQGTPISPMLTNLIMIPIDHGLFNSLRNFDGNHLIYTRYADDMDISCRVSFDFQQVVEYIKVTFERFDAPYELKPEKMHYGNRNGRNWILGVMYNKDGNLTLGFKRKRALRATIADYVHRREKPDAMDYAELLSLNGTLAYFKKIEPEYTMGMVRHYEQKYNMNIIAALRADIRAA